MRLEAKAALAAASVAAGVALGGCSDSSGAEDWERVTLSVSANATADNAALPPISRSGHTLVIGNVDVRFEELTLERAEGSAGGGDSDGDSEVDSDSDGAPNRRFRNGSVTVPFPVNGGVFTPIAQELPPGLYEELEADVESVRLRGTYDGEDFDVTVPVNYELEADLEPLFEVTGAGDRLNITVAFDVNQWFIDSNGMLVDPRQLGESSQLRSRLITRIRGSFKAFEDSDLDADDADSDSDTGG